MGSNNMVNSCGDETQRVKFLCSFGGSILPRPQDGRLRYVGGETRIVSVPRDIGYEELMGRMIELYEDAAILKYQQPEEDLDALVSVVNDDDVVNMMEEYDKLDSAEAFTRLRIFLFSHPEHDASSHYMDGDERDTERRYVDALNSLSDSPDYRRQHLCDSPIMTPADEAHITDQFFTSMNLEGSVHSQRNYDMGAPNYNLQKLAVPNVGSGQLSTIVTQRFNEDSPWNPAYYSPMYAGPQDTHSYAEFPSSPSAGYYRAPSQEMPDRYIDRMPEDSHSQHINSHIPFEHHPQYAEQGTWGGYSGNILNGPTMGNGPSVCEHCRAAFQRNPSSSDFHSHVEQSPASNGLPHVINPCVECHPNREAGVYNNNQGDPRPLYNDTHISERNRVLQNQLRADESGAYPAGVGRVSDHYTVDSTARDIPIATGNLPDGHIFPPIYIPHEDPRYIRASASEFGGDIFHGPTAATGSHLHIPMEERSVCTTNLPYSYAADIPHQVLHGHPSQAMWRPAPAPVPMASLYDSSALQRRDSIPSGVVPISTAERSPRVFVGVDQSPWVDISAMPGQFPDLSPGAFVQEIQHTFTQGPLRNPAIPPSQECMRSPELSSVVLNNNPVSGAKGFSQVQREDTNSSEARLDEIPSHSGTSGSNHSRKNKHLDVDGVLSEQNDNSKRILSGASLKATNSNSISGEESMGGARLGESNTCSPAENPELSFLPELLASAKKAKMESVEVVKAKAQEDVGGDSKAVVVNCASGNVANADETEPLGANDHSDGGSENGSEASKIEPTKAEEEAIARGLQTIRNDDLEEIRELGTGTYGAVYYGKWKGSDVAIKRIKASCFAGRPSERERLIADFWKEALILSSLHHPNVVSFYGIVRDGPDGSLATVTEYMINGSLKQYLRKKDRTIDRRKRLIIAMDAAFGMEYLHGKNIVHFDLKCENLLVNMRDPHRPVCKIGDLGLSKVKHQTLVSGGVRGTLPWMAPELLSGKSSMVTEKIDVYSFGIVMWELLSGEEPYSDMHCASIIGGIVNNTLRPQIPAWCDPEWKSLMGSCWAADPSERPSFSEISQKLRNMAAAMNVK